MARAPSTVGRCSHNGPAIPVRVTTLLENPLPAILAGIVVEAILGVILVRTGRGMVLGIMGGVLLLVLALVGIEALVVTEPERVEQALEAGRAALEANDTDAVIACLAPQAEATQRLVRWAMRRVELTRVKITQLDVGPINALTSPPSVKVRMAALIEFRDRQGEFPYNHRPIEFDLTLRRYDDRWLVTEHEWVEDPYGQR